MSIIPGIPIMLDKERHLRLTLESAIRLEEETNTQLSTYYDQLTKNPRLKAVRNLLWAFLIDEDENLTLKDVGKMVNLLSDMPRIIETLTQAFEKQFQKKEDTSPN